MHRRLILGLAAFAGLATAMPAFTAAAYAEPAPHHEIARHEIARHRIIHRAPIQRVRHLRRIIHRTAPHARVG